MKIAVDTLFLGRGYERTGTGVYLKHLLQACLGFCEAKGLDIEFHGFLGRDDTWNQNGLCSARMHVHETKLMANLRAWCFGGMALSILRAEPDLLFLPTAHGAITNPFKSLVVTVLDTMPRRLPQHAVETSAAAHQLTWVNARLAKSVMTISEWSRRDIVEVYGIPPEKVQVTYLGYDKAIYNTNSIAPEISGAVLERYGIRRPFILHHGMVQRRKNLCRLIQAWDRVLERNRTLDVQLVLAGPMGLGHEEVRRMRESSPNGGQVVLTGPVLENDLAVIIKDACLSVFPSLYEGFCLPMVESMACGVPAVVSNSSCLPEVSGGVLEYFDPLSVEEMSQTIQGALEDSELRERLRREGLVRAAEYSWERCARETLRIFEDSVRLSEKRKVLSTVA